MKKLTIEYCKEKSKERGFLIKTKEYINNEVKLEFVHLYCGYVFYMAWRDFGNGQGCPKCGGKVPHTLDFCKKEAISRGYEMTSNNYENSRTKIQLTHLSCGYHFETSWASFYNQGSGCPKCSGRMFLTIEYLKEEVKNFEYILISNKYVSAKEKMKFLHLKCGSKFFMTWDNFNHGRRCPICNSSKGEERIRIFLESNGFKREKDYFREMRFDDCKYKNTLPFDFYVPSYNLLIEYQGEQHFRAVDYFGGIESFLLGKKKDSIKKKCLIYSFFE